MSIKTVQKDYTKEVLADLQRKELAFVTTAGQVMQSDAKVLAPVDTGNLRSSIQTVAYVENALPVAEVGPTADYAPYVELGTNRQRAQPYMATAWDKLQPRLDRLYKKALEL